MWRRTRRPGRHVAPAPAGARPRALRRGVVASPGVPRRRGESVLLASRRRRVVVRVAAARAVLARARHRHRRRRAAFPPAPAPRRSSARSLTFSAAHAPQVGIPHRRTRGALAPLRFPRGHAGRRNTDGWEGCARDTATRRRAPPRHDGPPAAERPSRRPEPERSSIGRRRGRCETSRLSPLLPIEV
jgi:hypothetical protein